MMSDTVSFSDDIFFPAQSGSVKTILYYIEEHAPGDPEFEALIAKSEEFDRMGCWFFDELSFNALRKLSALSNEMSMNLATVAAKARWPEGRRSLFYSDFRQFQCHLAERIADLERSA